MNAKFVAQLKQGMRLQLQGTNTAGQIASYLLPLGGFGAAHEGPATDPRQFERDQIERRRDAPPSSPR